jgi:hypothetical protein
MNKSHIYSSYEIYNAVNAGWGGRTFAKALERDLAL